MDGRSGWRWRVRPGPLVQEDTPVTCLFLSVDDRLNLVRYFQFWCQLGAKSVPMIMSVVGSNPEARVQTAGLCTCAQ
jgi:hypothetical protein